MAPIKKWTLTGFGVLLIWAAIGFTSYAVAWQVHSHHAAQVLLDSEHAAMKKIAAKPHGAACVVSGQQQGQLSGILHIPALNLTAPVEEGTDDQELNVAIGHDPQSVWPGVDGAAVFLAHDVSYFVHLNELKPGDVITYQTACNTVKFTVSTQQIVAAGSDVSNTTGPSLVLDTCYPPNALFFTSQRLLVRATEISAATKGTKLSPTKALDSEANTVNYSVPAPPAL
jgi:LPXTG-site transpeptidase (sortase) family protein